MQVISVALSASRKASQVKAAPDGRTLFAEACFWIAVLFAICLSSVSFAQYGTLDSTWGGANTGYTKTTILSATSTNARDTGRSIAVQLDGKVIVAGLCYNGTSYAVCVARYTTSGALDTSFNSTGKNAIAITGGDPNYSATAVATTPYGEILVVTGCRDGSNILQFCAVRFSSNGALDTSFGTSGLLMTTLSTTNNYPTSLMYQSDGRFIIGGLCGNRICAIRYFEEGDLLDNFTPFGTAGIAQNIATGTFNRETFFMTLDASDRVLLGGSCFVNSRTVFCVSRFSVDGTIDTTFGSNGIAAYDVFPSGGYAYGMAVQDDGKILLAGQTFNTIAGENRQDYALVRYTTTGALDTSFGNNGVVITRVGNWDSTARAVVSLSDGKIVVAGYCQDFPERRDRFCLAGFNANGTLDTSFNAAGAVPGVAKPTLVGYEDLPYSITLGRDGKLLVAGSCRYASGSNQTDFCIARYNGSPTGGRACVVDLSGDGNVRATQDSLALSRITDGIWEVNPSAVLFAFNTVLFTPRQIWEPFKRWQRGSFDYDGDGVETATDTLIHSRVALGFTGNSVTNGLPFAPTATRATWSTLRNHFVSRCGMTLP